MENNDNGSINRIEKEKECFKKWKKELVVLSFVKALRAAYMESLINFY